MHHRPSVQLCTALCALLLSLPVAALDTIDPADIRPGMKGYGLTVFAGTRIEKFDVEVVDVVPNFMLRQDIILIKCHHPVTDHAGVIGGMSGSPIYLGGKLAGALAYGWTFSRDALAGVTPISAMTDLLKRKVRTLPRRPRTDATALLTDPLRWIREMAADTFFGKFAARPESRLVPSRNPISLSGFSGAARDMMEETLAPFGLDAVESGGGGRGNDSGPDAFFPGAPIGVQLIRGDLSATGIGTVTAVDGNHVLAFGHPMFNMGEGNLPVTSAVIHTVVASLARSNKMGSPLKELGSLVQDRNAAIVARTDLRAATVPVSLVVRDGRSGRADTYRVEVAERQWLTGRLIHAALVQFVTHAASDVADMTVEVKGRVKIAGRAPITLDDAGVSRSGLPPLVGGFRPASFVHAVLNNPFEDTAVDWVELDVTLHYGLDAATLSGLYLTSESPAAGDEINLHARLISFGGKETILTVPLRIPADAEGRKLKISAAGGGDARIPLPAPENLDDLINNLRRYHPARSLVVTVETEAESLTVRGNTLDDLPASAVSSLKPVAGDDQSGKFRAMRTDVIPTNLLISGQQSIQVTPRKRSN